MARAAECFFIAESSRLQAVNLPGEMEKKRQSLLLQEPAQFLYSGYNFHSFGKEELGRMISKLEKKLARGGI